MDTPPEEAFDRITRLVRLIFDVPIAAVTLIDGHRQWFKSRRGIDVSETDLAQSLCSLVVMQGEPLIVENALEDPRVQANPCVTDGLKLCFYAGIPLCTPEGLVVGTLCAADVKPRSFSRHDAEVLSDLSRIVLSEFELRTLATTDALTGAMSQRAFREEAGRALSLARRHRNDLSVLMFDLDHFKRVNDTHGHAAGDRVLQEVATISRAGIRTSDVIGRLGGEEFAILLPHTGASAAFAVAEKIRSSIAHLRISVANTTISVSVSFGISNLDASVGDVDVLLERAVHALYAAKADGRNRCSAWLAPVQATPPDLRRRVLKGGRIAFNAGHSTIDCTVRSLSQMGAGIDLFTTANVPDMFKLHIFADDFHRARHVTTRNERRLEVTFG